MMGRKFTAAAVAAGIVLLGSGPIYAQKLRVVAGGVQAQGTGAQTGSLNVARDVAPVALGAFNLKFHGPPINS